MLSQDGIDLPVRMASCFKFERITGFGPSIPTGTTHYGLNIFALALMVVLWLVRPARARDDSMVGSDSTSNHAPT